ncbi:MAG: hypothetical protein M1827_005758 [Pycnora praestabilis]|nr:MAG: hypothetical protein M1827_005758 [Pycnora praestabilis]
MAYPQDRSGRPWSYSSTSSQHRPLLSSQSSEDFSASLYGPSPSRRWSRDSDQTISPLYQTASPVSEHLPDALRVGSPALERGNNPYDHFPSPALPGPAMRNSQPFQSSSTPGTVNPAKARARPRIWSGSSFPDGDGTTPRHMSHPAALHPASTIEPVYSIPPAPAPPSMPSAVAFNPIAGSQPHTSGKGSASSTRSTSTGLLSKFSTSLSTKRPSYKTRGSSYGLLEEQDEEFATQKGLHGSIRESDEEDGTFGAAYDVSSFDGPLAPRLGINSIALQNLQSSPSSPAAIRERMQQEGGMAAEYHQLEAEEADGKLTRGLGKGMVVAALPITSKIASAMARAAQRHVRSGGRDAERSKGVRDLGLEAAKERGEMVAIPAESRVDLSSFGGFDTSQSGESMVDLTSLTTTLSESNSKTTYCFPPDPTKPNWRPFSMRWPYISLLVFISLALAVAQEYLYQLSNRLAHETPPDGLLRFLRPQQVPMWEYFCWRYLPTIIAVSYGLLWQIIEFEVKRLEPYYQLSKPTGALAKESLNLDYLTFYKLLAPFKALKYKQWAVVYCSFGSLLANTIIPPLQSASVVLDPQQSHRKDDEPKFVRIQIVWSRILSGFLVLVAVFGILLFFSLRRRSGLLSDPKGIAGIAAMANKSHILMDFKDLDTASHEDIHERLKHRRYVLHKSSLWQGEYISSSRAEHDQEKPQNPHPHMLRLVAGIPFISFMMAFSVIIPAFMFTNANVVTENAPWLLTGIAVIIKVLWTTLECDVRMIEPFYILSNRQASSEALTLDYTGTIPGWMPIKALLNRHYIVSLAGFGAVMCEVLTVCVSSFSVKGREFFPKGSQFSTNHGMNSTLQNPDNDRYNGEETFKSFWVSFGLALGILLFLCFAASLIYVRRRHAFLPRQPGTIASVLAFIHQSKMLWDFVDTEMMEEKAMEAHLAKIGKTYGLGWFRARDGEDHCGVDEEPLIGDYKHGKRFGDATSPWTGWDRF